MVDNIEHSKQNDSFDIKKFNKHSHDIEQVSNEISVLAGGIWREHYTPIIGIEQVEYMLEKYQSSKQIYEDICKNDFTYFTAENNINKMLVGYAACQPKDSYMNLSKIYVHKDYRGNGISRSFILEIEKLCRNEYRFNKIRLTVNKNNKNSIAVYNKIGFKTIDSVKVDIGNGFYMDDYVMEMELSPGCLIVSS